MSWFSMEKTSWKETIDRDLPGEDRRLGAFLFVVGLLAVLPYLGVLDSPYVFDDVKLVRDNKDLGARGPGVIGEIAGTFDVTSRQWSGEELRANYRPLRFLSYRLDYYLSTVFFSEEDFNPGEDPPPVFFFHLQNIFWHALNALLVFLLGRRLLSSDTGGLVTALLFALHPVQTEAVTYISSRRDVLSTFFFLACLVLYLRTPRAQQPGWGTLVFGPVLLAAGLLAKEMVVTLPAVLLLVDLFRRPVLGGRRLVFHSLLWLVALSSTAITLSTPGLVASQTGGGGLAVIYNASLYVFRYLELLVFPVSQSIDYSYAAIPGSSGLFSPPTVAVSMLLVLALVLVSAWAYRRGGGLPGLALLWFLGTLVPVLQFVPIAEQFAEHFAYLPSIGIALLAGHLLLKAWKANQFSGRAITALLVILCFVLTVLRNGEWDTRESLYASAVREQPQCARAHFEYGNALIESRGLGSEDALAQFDRALELWQNLPLETYLGYKLRIHAQRALSYSVLGEKSPARLRDSIREFRLLFSQRDSDGKELEKSTQPVLLGLRRQLASCLERAGDLDEALLEYRKVIELDRDSRDALAARFQVHQILMNRKEVDGAISVLEEIIDVAGSKKTAGSESLNAQLYLFTILLEHKKDFDSAEALIEGLLRTAGSDEEKVGFLLRWAQVFDRQGNLDACVAKLEEALQIDPASVVVLESIAPIESKRNRKEKAEEYFRRLLQVNPRNSIALQGLRELKVRKDAGPARGAKELEARKVLESMEETARGHEQRKQWPAARQSWGHIAEKAAEVGETSKLAEAYNGLARAEVQLVRPRQALGYLEKALVLGAGRPETLLAMGDLYSGQLEEPARAEDYYRQYLQALGPEGKASPGAYLSLARLVSARSALESIEFYEKAVSLGILAESGPSTAEIEKEMGLLYTKLGLWKQAFEMLSKYHKSLGEEQAEERRDIEEILNLHVLPKLIGDDQEKGGNRQGKEGL